MARCGYLLFFSISWTTTTPRKTSPCHFCQSIHHQKTLLWYAKQKAKQLDGTWQYMWRQTRRRDKYRFSCCSTATSESMQENEYSQRQTSLLPASVEKNTQGGPQPATSDSTEDYLPLSFKERKILGLLKDSKPQEAYKLFLRHPKLKITTPTMNQMLQKLGNSKRGGEMWDVYEKARSRGTFPSILTFTILLSRISSIPRDQQKAVVRLLHRQLLEERNRLETDMRAFNSLMYAYCQLGTVDTALQVFKNLKRDFGMDPNEVSCNIICKGLIQSSRFSEALEFFSVEMPAMNILPSVTSYAIIFEAFGHLGKLDQMSQLWKQMIQRGHQPTEAVYFSAMYACAIHGDLNELFDYYRKMVEDGIPPNIRMYGMIIDAIGKAGKLELAFSWLEKMSQQGIAPNDYIYTSLIYACGNVGDMELAMSVYESMRRSGIPGNIITLSTLLHGFCMNKYPLQAMNIFRRMCRAGYRLSKTQFHELFYCLGPFRMIPETLQVFETLVEQRNTCTTQDLFDILWNMSFAANDTLASLIYYKLAHAEAYFIQSDALYLYSQRKKPREALTFGSSRLQVIRSSCNNNMSDVSEFYHILMYIASLCGEEQYFFSLMDEMMDKQLANTRTLTVLICGIAQMAIVQQRARKKDPSFDAPLWFANDPVDMVDYGDTFFHSAMDEMFCLSMHPPKDSKEPYPEQLPWQLLDDLQPLWEKNVQKEQQQSSSTGLLSSSLLWSIFDICDKHKMAVDRLAYNATLWSFLCCNHLSHVDAFYTKMQRDGVCNAWTRIITTMRKVAQEDVEECNRLFEHNPNDDDDNNNNNKKNNSTEENTSNREGIEYYNIMLNSYRRRQGNLDNIFRWYHHMRRNCHPPCLDRWTYQIIMTACLERRDRTKALALMRHMKEARVQWSMEQWKALSRVANRAGLIDLNRWLDRQALQQMEQEKQRQRVDLQRLHEWLKIGWEKQQQQDQIIPSPSKYL